MKKLILLLISMIFVLSLNAQYTTPIENTSMISYGFGFNKIIPKNKDAKVTTVLQLGGSYILKHLYFKDKLIFQHIDDASLYSYIGVPLIIYRDTDPRHGYQNSFFENSYTRLTGQYIRLKLGGGVLFYQFISVTTGINTDIRLGSKYKNKYFVDGEKKKNIITGNDVLKLCNTQFSWFLSVNLKDNISVYYEYQFRNFLKKEWDSNIKNHGIGISFTIGSNEKDNNKRIN